MLSRSLRAPALRRTINCCRTYATRYPPPPKSRQSRNPKRNPGISDYVQHNLAQERNTAKILRNERSRQEDTTRSELPRDSESEPTLENSLLSPVHIPEDPIAVLKENHPAAKLLANSGLVIQRRLELMNVLLDFEQANRYTIMDANGNHVGYIAERDNGFGNAIARQMFRTHRSFTAHVFDTNEVEILRICRPFSWINSYIRVYDPLNNVKQTYLPPTSDQHASSTSMVAGGEGLNPKISELPLSDMRIIGEVQQQWAPLRRKYNLFIYHPNPTHETDLGTQQANETGLSQAQKTQLISSSGKKSDEGEYHQFAYVNEVLLSWDFALRSADDRLIGSVNRDFSGFVREIFTDTGVYALRMDSAALAEDKERQDQAAQTSKELAPYTDKVTGMTLDQRAVMLATAISIDFDYFSRHSSSSHGAMPLMFPGTTSAEGAAAGAESAAGAGVGATAGSTAIGEAGSTAAGRAAGAAGSIAEGTAAGMAGAGTMAGYEAMQRGMHERNQHPNSPQDQPSNSGQPGQSDAPDEVWGEAPPNQWSPRSGDGSNQNGIPGGDAGEGGGGTDGGDDFFDFF